MDKLCFLCHKPVLADDPLRTDLVADIPLPPDGSNPTARWIRTPVRLVAHRKCLPVTVIGENQDYSMGCVVEGSGEVPEQSQPQELLLPFEGQSDALNSLRR